MKSNTYLFVFLLCLLTLSLAIACGDDDDDDDAVDDDTGDDDTGDDDTGDDDTGDDDTGDDDTGDDDDDPLTLTNIAGGTPGYWGSSLVIGDDDTVYIAGITGLQLFIYTYSEKGFSKDFVVNNASHPSLCIDENGALHVAFTTITNSTVMVANNASGQWQFESLTDDWTQTSVQSLALGPDGTPHLVFYNYTTQEIVYAVKQAGSWALEDFAPTRAGTPAEMAITVDDDNRPHIVFADFDTAEVIYTYKNGDSWAETTLPYTGTSSSLGVIACDDSGDIHIVYNDNNVAGNTVLTYRTNESGSWQAETIATEDTIKNVAIDVDGTGDVHVTYTSKDSGVQTIYIKYATNQTDGWAITDTAEVEYDAYTFTALAADGSGTAHICYNDLPNYSLMYTTGAKEAVVVDRARYLGETAPSAVDGNGNYHALSFDLLNDELYYFTNASGQWQGTKIADANTDIASRSAALAVGGDGSVHALRFDTDSEFGLLYLLFDGESWTEDLIANRIMHRGDIAVDSQNRPHIVYQNSPGEDYYMQYVTGEIGDWETTTLLTDLTGTTKSKIVIDSADHPHVLIGASPMQIATNASGEWQLEEILDDPHYESTVALAIDADDALHVAYADSNFVKIVYGTNRSGTWEFEAVAPYTLGVNYMEIAVDESGAPHLLFTETYIWTYAFKSEDAWQTTALSSGDTPEDMWDYGSLSYTADGLVAVGSNAHALWCAEFPAGYVNE